MNETKELKAHPLVDREWDRVLDLVPVDLDSTAKADKALLRRREVQSGADLLRLVFAYTLCDWSLRLVGLWATIIQLGHLSDVAVMKRLQRCQTWLGNLIAAWLKKHRVDLPQREVRLRLIDATTASEPGSTGTNWRIHLSLNLGQMRLDGVEVTDAKGGETLVRHPTQPGDIVVADRGYAHRRGLGSVFSEGGKAVVRINWHNLPSREETGEPLDIIAWLRQAPQTGPAERTGWIDTPQGPFEVRLVVHRLSQEAADRARQRIRRQARKKKRTPDQRTLEAASFVILVTNLPLGEWSGQQVLELYRVRWQVELLIKRSKGVFRLDHLRAQDPTLVQVYLLGKLLAMLIADELTGHIAARYPEWFESVERPVSPWRLAVLLADGLRQAVCGEITLARILEALPDLGRYLRDAPRKRRQQWATARALLRGLNCA
jgi:hypothetical protein